MRLSLVLAGLFLASSSFGTGFAITRVCETAFEEYESPTLVFNEVSLSAPGGPVHRSGTLEILGMGTFKYLAPQEYSDGIKVFSYPLESPSGALSSKYAWFTVTQLGEEEAIVNEVLYSCESQLGGGRIRFPQER